MKNRKAWFTIGLCCSVLLVFSVWSWFRSPDLYSETERRTLAHKPAFSVNSLADGSYMDRYEAYAADQFPMREAFRTLKAASARYLFGRADEHGVYRAQGHLSRLERVLHTDRLELAVNTFDRIDRTLLAGTACRRFLCIIPDKNYYLTGGYPRADYDALMEYIRENTAHDAYIDIRDLLSAEDFYTTDQHWRQECILDAADRICAALEAGEPSAYTIETLDVPFRGAYAGQSALPAEPDTIRYLTNRTLTGCTVTALGTGMRREIPMYDAEKAHGRDAYDLFLSGADPLIEIHNPAGIPGKELVIFRDSFGSSLAPLLIRDYEKVTLVDLRYIRMDTLKQYLTFENQDVLILYSTLILNNFTIM